MRALEGVGRTLCKDLARGSVMVDRCIEKRERASEWASGAGSVCSGERQAVVAFIKPYGVDIVVIVGQHEAVCVVHLQQRFAQKNLWFLVKIDVPGISQYVNCFNSRSSHFPRTSHVSAN